MTLPIPTGLPVTPSPRDFVLDNWEDDRTPDEREAAFPWWCSPCIRHGADHTTTPNGPREADET